MKSCKIHLNNNQIKNVGGKCTSIKFGNNYLWIPNSLFTGNSFYLQENYSFTKHSAKYNILGEANAYEIADYFHCELEETGLHIPKKIEKEEVNIEEFIDR